MKKLNIRPDTGVYGTYKRISYQPWTALAEFVDNSTQSFYDHKKELFETKYYKGLEIEIIYREDPTCGDEIKIIDNAFGMDYSDFQRAIILDRPPKNTKGRNEFGMGLKAAACWFGNLWSVESTSLGSYFKYKAEIDIDNLVKYKTETIDVEEEQVNPKDHYTVITIQKLNKKIKGKRIEKKIHELLSSIYRVDLRTGDIKIFYNGEQLEFEEVEPYQDENGKVWKKDIEFTVPHKGEELHVKGFIAIRIPGSTRNAGFTLLRRGRVIVGGPDKNYRPYEVFGPSNLYTYQRMYGEIEMDDWPVTQAKDAFDWSNEDLESKFIDKLKELSNDYHEYAEKLRTREKVKLDDVAEQLSRDFSNNNKIDKAEVVIKKQFDEALANRNDEDNNYSDNDELFLADEQQVSNESAGIGVDIEGNSPLQLKMSYNGKDYDLTFVFDDKNPKSEWLKIEVGDTLFNKYTITLNTKHAFFYPFIQKKDFLVLLAKFATALVIAEINAYSIATDGMVNPTCIRSEMGRILEDLKTNE